MAVLSVSICGEQLCQEMALCQQWKRSSGVILKGFQLLWQSLTCGASHHRVVMIEYAFESTHGYGRPLAKHA